MGCLPLNKSVKSFDVYLWGIVCLGIALLCMNIPSFEGWAHFLEVCFLGALIAFGETLAIPFPKGKGTASVAAPLIFTVIVLHGPAIGMWVASLFTLRRRDLVGQVPLKLVLFNRGMLSICAYVFSIVYAFLGGEFGFLEFPSGLLAFVLAALAYTMLNAVMTGEFVSLQTGLSFLTIWRQNIVWMLPNMFALFPLGALMVVVTKQAGPLVLLLFYLPLVVTKMSLQKYVDLKDTYGEMAEALGTAVDARDPYTQGHSIRVSEYSGLLGKEMGLDDEEVDLLKHVALLHDVGKVGIPDNILKKTDYFTYEEYEEMKKHVDIGADIIGAMKTLSKGAEWVRYHHERWDGTGFPKGLRGEEIPLEARIIACADAFDAMTTDRPYKERMDYEEARKEIIRCSGTQFDPQVVEAMLKVIDEKILRK